MIAQLTNYGEFIHVLHKLDTGGKTSMEIETATLGKTTIEIGHFWENNKENDFCSWGCVQVCGAVEMAKRMGPGHTIVTVLCDSGFRYGTKCV